MSGSNSYTLYSSVDYETIVPGVDAIYSINVDALAPTQLNVGFTEVDTKAEAFNEITSAAALQADLLEDIEPVVIGPDGQLYNTDGQHTFLALEDSAWGSSDPYVNVNIIANFSGDTEAQFWTAMESLNLLYPVNDGTLETVNVNTGSPYGLSLQDLTSDVYRGLEYSILKNKLSKLFTSTSNIAGVTGSALPGLDKTAAFYSDFIWADAYRSANGGEGLPTLTPSDILLDTAWNLNGASAVTLPNQSGGTTSYTVAQLPGYILEKNISISSVISNTTLANGTLDGNGTFTGLTALDLGLVTIGSDAPGFVMQLGADAGFAVTLTGANTYTGGTTIIAGTLIINADAALGAAGTAVSTSGSSLTADIEAADGIIFDSLTEGNGTLEITSSFTESRAIGVNSEQANINLNNYDLTLSGPIYSLGALGIGLSNAGLGATGDEAPITVEDLSSGDTGVLTIAASANNSNFYGDWVIGGASGAGTLVASNDASLGNTNSANGPVGEIDLDGGIFQAGASFSSVRTVFLSGSSNYDVNGYATSWAGGLQDTQRVLIVQNSSSTAGSVTFANMQISATATLDLAVTSGAVRVYLTGGFARSAQSTVVLSASTSTSAKTQGGATLGTSTNYEVFNNSGSFSSGGATLDGIDAPWIVQATAVSSTGATYSFVTYGTDGYVAATASSSGNTATLSASSGSSTVDLAANATASGNVAAFALNVGATTVALGSYTLTLGDGTDPTGLVLNGGKITGGTIATGASELVIWSGGATTTANSISAAITGSGGITLAGENTLTLSAVASETGQVVINSGTLSLTTANVFATDTTGLDLSDTKSHPAAATLTITASQKFSTLDSVGSNSAVNWSGSNVILTIGDSNNESSTLSSTLTQSGSAVSGALTIAGTGLTDLSGGKISLYVGTSQSTSSSIQVNAGAILRVGGTTLKTANIINLGAGAELQYAGNQGSQLADDITGTGVFHLIGGTVQLTGANNYSGGTVLELGTTLDLTTANVSTGNANITDAGGLVDFDQNTSGTYSGVISDGFEAGGASDLDDLAATSGTAEQGSLVKDDSATGNAGNVTITAVQTFTGGTFIEAGTLTLGVANAVADSSGVTIGRVGYDTTATLALGANNQIQTLASSLGATADATNSADVITVALNSYNLTIAPAAGVSATYAGTISGSGELIMAGSGTEILSGANSFSGGTVLESGTLELTTATAAGTGAISFAAGSTATLAIAAGITPSGSITGLAVGGTIDLLGVGTETAFSYNSTTDVLSLTGGSSSVSITVTPAAHDDFVLASDGNGGTDVTVAAVAIASITGQTGTAVNGGTIEITGTGVAGSSITLYSAGVTVIGTGTVASNGTFDITSTATFSDGSFSITATQTDAKGVVSAASPAFTADVNPSAPSLTGVVGQPVNMGTVEVTGTGENGDTISLYADGTTDLVGTGTVGSDGSFDITTSSQFADGNYSITAIETDVAGFSSTASASINAAVDPNAPVITGQAGTAVDGGTIELLGTGENGETVTIYDGSTAVGSGVVANDGSFDITTSTDFAQGDYTLTAVQTDIAGLSSTQSDGYDAEVACFAAGARLLTTRGYVAVEDLAVDDELLTLREDGPPTSKIVWIGSSAIDLARHARPEKVQPVRIKADAFAPGMPERDLRLSPDHALYIDGHLIEAKNLVNGATIIQETATSRVTYFHIELASHDVVLAEGLPAETYLDSGNRGLFEGQEVLHPDFAAQTREGACAPLLLDGEIMMAARQRLLDRALSLGYAITSQIDLCARAAGRVVAAQSRDQILSFAVPAGAGSIDLLSSIGVPAEVSAHPGDRRRLGVAVAGLALVGPNGRTEIALDAAHGGLHGLETNGGINYRWTNGNARLALPAHQGGVLEVTLLGQMARWNDSNLLRGAERRRA